MDKTTRSVVVIGGVLLVATVVLSTVTGGMMMSHMRGFGAPQGGGWMWGFGMGLGGLMMLLFWGALIAGIVLLARSINGGGADAPWETTSLDVLKRRYAAGEITREQYEQMRRDIEH